MRKDDPLFIYTLNQTVHWFMVGITFPVLILLITSRGLNLLDAGVLISTYSATTILLELPTGGLADVIGRKRIYLFSLLFTLLSGAVLVFADSFPLFLIGFCTFGVARALSSGSMDAWFVDEFKRTDPDGNLQSALAKANIYIPLGIGVASLIGGFLPTVLGDISSLIPGTGPFSINMIVAMLVAVIQMAITMNWVWEDRSRFKGTIRDGMREVPATLSSSIQLGIKDRFTFALLIAMFFLGLGIASVELLWQPRAYDLMNGLGATWVLGVLAAGYFFSGSLGNMLSTRTCQLFKNDYLSTLTVLRILTGLLLIVLALQSNIFLFALFYFLLFMTNGLVSSPHAMLFNNRIPKEKRSTLMSFESLVLQGGGLMGSLAMGYIANTYGIPSAWTVAGIILIFSAATYASLRMNRVHN